MGRVLALLVTVCMLLAPSAAHAHGALKSSTPGKNAKLGAAPNDLGLVFNEPVELVFTRVELAGPNGKVSLGTLKFAGSDKRAVNVDIDGALVAGRYTVTWQMAGADGHPIRGNYTFSIEAGATGLAMISPVPGADSLAAGAPGVVRTGKGSGAGIAQTHHNAETFPDAGGLNAESPLYVVIRWLQFGAILVVTGAVAFYLFVLGLIRKKEGSDLPVLLSSSERAARVGLYAALILAAVAVARLLAQSYAMHAPGTGFAPALMLSMIGLTTWGWGWLLQAVATVIAITGFASALKKPNGAGWKIATAGVVLGAFAPALSGHAAAAPMLRPLAVVADGLHIIGASGWIGSLLVLLIAGIPAAMALDKDDRGQAVARLVNAFSPTALVFAGLTALTGVFAAWLHLESIPALWQTDYGTMLLRKLIVLSIVAGIGAYNFRVVKPRLGTAEGATKMKRSAIFEVGVAAVVLLITAILVATPPAMDSAEMTTAARPSTPDHSVQLR